MYLRYPQTKKANHIFTIQHFVHRCIHYFVVQNTPRRKEIKMTIEFILGRHKNMFSMQTISVTDSKSIWMERSLKRLCDVMIVFDPWYQERKVVKICHRIRIFFIRELLIHQRLLDLKSVQNRLCHYTSRVTFENFSWIK